MATARKRGEYWYYRFKVRNGDSYKWIERGDNYRTKKEALDAGNKAEAEWHTRLSIWEPRQVLYRQMLKEWQINWCNVQYKGSTLDSVRKDINIVISYLGDKYIHQITPAMMQDVLTDLAGRHYSRNRIGKVKGIFYKSMRFAVQQGWLRNNPASAVHVPAPRAAKRLGCSEPKELRALTKEEVEAIFRRFPEGSTAYIPLILGLRCGCRLGEAFGLEIEDVDIENQCIHIRQQLGYHGSDLVISDCKYESMRTVTLDNDTMDILKRHVEQLNSIREMFGNSEQYRKYYVQQDGKVTETPGIREVNFLNRRMDISGKLNGPRISQHVSRVIHGCTLDFGYPAITDFSFHQLRHTHITNLVSEKFPIEWISKRVGHAHIDTTYRYYVHESEEVRLQSAEQFKNFYS